MLVEFTNKFTILFCEFYKQNQSRIYFIFYLESHGVVEKSKHIIENKKNMEYTKTSYPLNHSYL